MMPDNVDRPLPVLNVFLRHSFRQLMQLYPAAPKYFDENFCQPDRTASPQDAAMDDLLSEFLTETSENLAVLDVEIVKLERNPNDPDLLSNIFRLVHTIKGTCGFLGLPRLEAVAHAAENVLGKFRDGELEVTPTAVTLILTSLDTIKQIVGELEATEKEPSGDDSQLIEKLNRLADGEEPDVSDLAAPAIAGAGDGDAGDRNASADGQESKAVPAAAAAEMDAAIAAMMDEEPSDSSEPAASPAQASPGPASPNSAQPAEPAVAASGGGGENSSPASPGGPDAPPAGPSSAVAAPGPDSPKADSPKADSPKADSPKADSQAAEAGTAETVPVASHQSSPPKPAEPKAGPSAQEVVPEARESVASQSIRVNVNLLENLMTMVSELVLTRNQLLQILRHQKDSEFAAPLQRLNHVTSELQEGVMKTRMQPIGNAWAKLPRIIRDLSQDLHKKIDLQMLGAETELDRQVLDLIKDPLTHMVRNSADHGIETVSERVAAGKTEVGTVRLNAYHEGGHIIIEITDDGRGLAVEKIKAKAIANGLATEGEIANLTEAQIQQFIFKPGFSTAAQVTSVSGRGVGMDVVRTNIEKIGGTIELKSREGRGSTFIIKIPLTLAIVSALVVECGGERFAIPQISVVELVRAGGNSEHSVERINNTPVLRLRDRLLPLVSLRELLHLEEAGDAEAGGGPSAEDAFIVVAQVGTYSFGIIVDRVFDTEEIVVKPVAPILRHIEMFSGNTILGDGSVIMILDPNGIASSTGEVSMAEAMETAETKVKRSRRDDAVSLLVFRAGMGTQSDAPKAVPLALVARLEDIDVTSIEYSNNHMVVQYRDRLMPLIPFDPGFSLEMARADEAQSRKPVLVFADGDRSMGLIVDEIVDIVEQPLKVELGGERTGLLGSAIIAGRATDVIDAGYFLTQAYDDWFESKSEALEDEEDPPKILLIDDSPFFRNMLSPLLTVAGYEVTAASGAEEALAHHESGADFEIIVSDIEMPGMNGFELAEKIRTLDRWANLPMIALSSHATPRDLDRGRRAGFTDYVAKFDRDAILSAIRDTLAQVKEFSGRAA